MLYRNTMTGETRTKEGWQHWAEGFYSNLAYDDRGRCTSSVRYINVLIPTDWWERVQKVLRLEPLP